MLPSLSATLNMDLSGNMRAPFSRHLVIGSHSDVSSNVPKGRVPLPTYLGSLGLNNKRMTPILIIMAIHLAHPLPQKGGRGCEPRSNLTQRVIPNAAVGNAYMRSLLFVL